MTRSTIDDVFEELKDDPRVADAIAEGNAAHEAGRLLREMRAEAGLSQRALADKMGVAQARISEIENPKGPNGPSYRIIREAAQICGFRWPSTIAELGRFDTEAPEDTEIGERKAPRRLVGQKLSKKATPGKKHRSKVVKTSAKSPKVREIRQSVPKRKMVNSPD